jgi:aminoglycoside 6'-N-acetyltransferase
VLAFRRLAIDDLPMVRGWLNEARVNRWYRGKPWTLEDVERKYLPRIEGEQPTKVYVVSIDGTDAGLIQSYWIADYPEYSEAIGGEPGWMGVDFLIGDPRFRGRGNGSRMIREGMEP